VWRATEGEGGTDGKYSLWGNKISHREVKDKGYVGQKKKKHIGPRQREVIRRASKKQKSTVQRYVGKSEDQDPYKDRLHPLEGSQNERSGGRLAVKGGGKRRTKKESTPRSKKNQVLSLREKETSLGQNG